MIILASNASLVAAQLGAHSASVAGAVNRVVSHHAMLLQTRVKAKASGRPGPRTVTGDYRRSISRRVERGVGGSTAEVGTNNPQGRRLEFGFTGADSLGRYYDQPPFPHFGPALDEVEPDFLSALGDAAIGQRG